MKITLNIELEVEAPWGPTPSGTKEHLERAVKPALSPALQAVLRFWQVPVEIKPGDVVIKEVTCK
jgi:hypothetical protein